MCIHNKAKLNIKCLLVWEKHRIFFIAVSHFLKSFEQSSSLAAVNYMVPKSVLSALQLLDNMFIYLKINLFTIKSTVDGRLCTHNSVVLVLLIYFSEKNRHLVLLQPLQRHLQHKVLLIKQILRVFWITWNQQVDHCDACEEVASTDLF